MTIASMTGFARAAADIVQGSVAWELKSVNGKGLDIRLRVPNGFDAQEAEFRARVAAALGRGTCQATLAIQRAPRTPDIRVDRTALAALIKAVTEVVPPGSSIGPATLDGLLAVRGVVELGDPSDAPEDREALLECATRLLDTALTDLRATRLSEGAALRRLLLDQLGRIAGLTEAAEQAPGRTPAAIRARLDRLIATLMDQVPALDPNRLHQEAVLAAARADVREELDRLKIHNTAARDLLQQGGIVGRKLDFLAQELAREANTLCAKSNDAGLTAIGLDLRNTIEQLREQVQNLE